MNLQSCFEQFHRFRILIVGDVMLDSYIEGEVQRISPEAPVPIVHFRKEDHRLGGAANVALNVLAMGAKAVICSVTGNDNQARKIADLMGEAGIDSSRLVLDSERKTTVKTRVVGNHQQLLRIDSEQTDAISDTQENALLKSIEKTLNEGIDAVIFEDYNKGVLTERVIQTVIQWCKDRQVPTAVDPKKNHFFSYKGVTLFKPNLKELKEGVGFDFTFHQHRELFLEALEQLEKRIDNEISFVTLSEHGVFVKKKEEQFHAHAHVRNIADVSGAGDTVIAVATLCLISNLSLQLIAEISNLAGGLVCEESGVVSVNREKLLREANRMLFGTETITTC
jgi:rfaE bifunctional protein kinase chain/domain